MDWERLSREADAAIIYTIMFLQQAISTPAHLVRLSGKVLMLLFLCFTFSLEQ